MTFLDQKTSVLSVFSIKISFFSLHNPRYDKQDYKQLSNLSDEEVFVQTGRSVVNKLQSKLINSIDYISEKISGSSITSGKNTGKVQGFFKHFFPFIS